MDPRLLEQLIDDALVEYLAERVVARLHARRAVALALFSGTHLGGSDAVQSLGALRAEGWTVRCVFSATARQIRWPEALAGFDVSASWAGPSGAADEASADALLDGVAVLIVPCLSINSAAKIAGGVRDSVPSLLVARALERGVAVVAASDGCCPDNAQRIAQGFHVSDAYKGRMRANLQALQSYGVRLVRAQELARAVHRLTTALAVSLPALPLSGVEPPVGVVPAIGAETRASTGKRVFSRSDAVQLRESVLRLGRDVLVTALAADELRSRNIRLIRT